MSHLISLTSLGNNQYYFSLFLLLCFGEVIMLFEFRKLLDVLINQLFFFQRFFFPYPTIAWVLFELIVLLSVINSSKLSLSSSFINKGTGMWFKTKDDETGWYIPTTLASPLSAQFWCCCSMIGQHYSVMAVRETYSAWPANATVCSRGIKVLQS